MRTLIVLLLVFMAGISVACEFGTTCMDTYGKATIEEIKMCKQNPNTAFILVPPYTDTWTDVHFDEKGKIYIQTEYNGSGQKFMPKGREPYVLYKGHRWYPQYHGIIYVYEDGREVK